MADYCLRAYDAVRLAATLEIYQQRDSSALRVSDCQGSAGVNRSSLCDCVHLVPNSSSWMTIIRTRGERA